MDDTKMAVVQDWPTPKNLKEVQSFLGFANFYRQLIKNYSRTAAALIELTRKNKSFRWGESQQVVAVCTVLSYLSIGLGREVEGGLVLTGEECQEVRRGLVEHGGGDT